MVGKGRRAIGQLETENQKPCAKLWTWSMCDTLDSVQTPKRQWTWSICHLEVQNLDEKIIRSTIGGGQR